MRWPCGCHLACHRPKLPQIEDLFLVDLTLYEFRSFLLDRIGQQFAAIVLREWSPKG